MKLCFLRRSNRVQDNNEHGSRLTVAGSDISELRQEAFDRINHLDSGHHEKRSSHNHPLKSKPAILDPGGEFIRKWNAVFFTASVVSLFIDSLFFLLPEVHPDICVELGISIKVLLTLLRTVADMFYVAQILVRFRTAFVSPLSRAVGRGELVVDRWKIASRYLRFGFWNDLIAAIPLPQILIWVTLPTLTASATSGLRTNLIFIILLQMFHRFVLAYPLSLRFAKDSGIITEKAWAAAAYNLMFYLLASTVSGCCWYLLAVQRQEACWKSTCDDESPACVYRYFDCSSLWEPQRAAWLRSSNLSRKCDPDNNLYQFGIYSFVVTEDLSSGSFCGKFFFCLWWGIRNLSSQGQNLFTSISTAENIFSYLIGALGMVLFAFFIGNMQRYLQSMSVRLEEWRIKQADVEQWMHHRKLPSELRQSIRKYHKHKWMATRGVDEEVILNDLPTNLQRQTKRFLCFNLVRQVPLFEKLDDRTLDCLCERLKLALYSKGMHIVCEGEPVPEMLFVIRGHLFSYLTDHRQAAPYSTSLIGPNDFCGEELLTWALLDIRQRGTFPFSSRTVKAMSNVEGFSLRAEDLKFIAKQFPGLHSREIKHKLRFYSQLWRTWAACFIQAAWRRYRGKQNEDVGETSRSHIEKDSQVEVSLGFPSTGYEDMESFVPRPDAGIEVYAARLMADRRRSMSNRSW